MVAFEGVDTAMQSVSFNRHLASDVYRVARMGPVTELVPRLEVIPLFGVVSSSSTTLHW